MSVSTDGRQCFYNLYQSQNASLLAKNNLSVLRFKRKYTKKTIYIHIPNYQQQKLLHDLKMKFKHLKTFTDTSFSF